MKHMIEHPKDIVIPEKLPVLPIKGGVLFPNLMVPLILTSPRSQQLVDEALKGDKIVACVTQKKEEVEIAGPNDLYEIGTASTIMKMLRSPEGDMRILIQGIKRIRIKKYKQTEPFLVAEIEPVDIEEAEDTPELQALKNSVLKIFKEIAKESPYLTEELLGVAMNIQDAGQLADFIAAYMNLKIEEKQEILEKIHVTERLKTLNEYLARHLKILKLSAEIQKEVGTEISKAEREYYLREQLKAIQRELGLTGHQKEIEEFRERMEKAKLPQNVKEVALKELDRLASMAPGAPEYPMTRTYLEWLIELPWNKETTDSIDIKLAKRVLDEDHYNLESVKNRILEFLAVRKLKKDTKGPILAFVGPPGVGKTSLGKSIARALGRKFIRMSLGGIRDEAEIRGHRRTYIGALPGRIIQGLRQAGVKNPVFMLDEVDKIGLDFRGDPASALLEVLDPEQNNQFSDHYIEIPFDLSKVLFICTANITDTIPRALLDRMEIIEIPGYSDDEKVHIAQRYLIPRQVRENGLEDLNVRFDRRAILKIINEYTREAGVRNLERMIAGILRKLAVKKASGALKNKNIRITPVSVEKYLGPPLYYSEVALRKGKIGVATGMAVTPIGGEIIFVEATMMPGGRNLALTGQLGTVMKESAEAALTLVRTRAQELGIDPKFFEKHDIHIHVPAGAVPKDGPSAGVAIFTALVSLLTKKPIDPTVAMTGEITLQGMVIPVGGIKEKVLGAHRAGIKSVILPQWNRKDVNDVPKHVRDAMKFYFVNTVDDVIKILFDLSKTQRKKDEVLVETPA